MATHIPLDEGDKFKLIHLSIVWDLSPEQTLRKLLDDALSVVDPGWNDPMGDNAPPPA